MWKRFKRAFISSRTSKVDRYLEQATDIYNLERRLTNVKHKRTPFTHTQEKI